MKKVSRTDFPFFEKERIVDPLKAKSHGAKMSSLSINQSRKKVEELGNALNFYQEYRNEPVPPDPFITSAVKLIPAHTPPPNAVAKGLDLGKPLKAGKQPLQLRNAWLQKRNEKTEAFIPSFQGFAKTVGTDFGTSSKSVNVNHSIARGSISSLLSASKSLKNCSVTENNNNNDHNNVNTKEESVSLKTNEAKLFKKQIEPAAESRCGSASFDASLTENKIYSSCSSSSVSASASTTGAKKVNKIRTTPEDYGGDVEALKLPELFVQSTTEENPFIDVTVVSVVNAHNFVIQAADVNFNSELEELESAMFQWYSTHSVSDMTIKKHRVYGLVLPKQRICVRVLVLYNFKDGTVMVSYIDHGSMGHVKIRNLVPLKSEWKLLAQLSCHAKLEVDLSPELELEEDEDFRNKFESKLVTVKPIRGSYVPAEYTSDSGVQFKCSVKCCEVEFYDVDEENEVEEEEIGVDMEQLRIDIENWASENPNENYNLDEDGDCDGEGEGEDEYQNQDDDEKLFTDCLSYGSGVEDEVEVEVENKNVEGGEVQIVPTNSDSDDEDWTW